MSETTLPRRQKLLDQLQDAIRIKHYTCSTGKTRVLWIKRNIHFHNKCHPTEMDLSKKEALLSHLARQGNTI